ncbi:MAG: hypothetical protein E6J34_14025 [Chloroflexi bacterium]|nr:MAG: hypothetical protein E6J34_14025 [Chloroflexota bacterium]
MLMVRRALFITQWCVLSKWQRRQWPGYVLRYGVLVVLLVACSGFNQDAKNTIAVSKLHWCGKPSMIFQDEGAVSSKTVTDWAQIQPNLGFTVFLPATLPGDACLVSASGTLHDPIFGSSFTIGYLLPDHSALSLSEAPLRSQNRAFQCSPPTTVTGGNTTKSATAATAKEDAVQLCSGARATTNIVLSARGTTATLEQFFQALEPDVNWIPT